MHTLTVWRANVQKHGLKVYMRDPHAFTPMLEESVGGAPPRSLTLGSDLVMNQREIGKFSQRDAKVRNVQRLCLNCAYLEVRNVGVIELSVCPKLPNIKA